MDKLISFYKEKIRRKKYYIKYAVIAQAILLLAALAILVNYNLGITLGRDLPFNYIYYIVIPTFLYFVFEILYLDSYKKYKKTKGASKSLLFVLNSIMATNVVYLILSIADKESGLYFISSVIIQLINCFAVANYIVSDSSRTISGKQVVVFKIYVYTAILAAIATLVACFNNPFLIVPCLIITSIMQIIAFVIFDSYVKRGKRTSSAHTIKRKKKTSSRSS